MRIGLVSDSHGRAARTAAAITMLRSRHVHVIVHLGDLETESVIDELAGHPVRIVFGNCDDNLKALTQYARSLDLQVDHPMGIINADGKRIAFTHGHLEQCMTDAIASGVDYLLHGHFHEIRDETVGQTRILNPGALFRARRYTVGILDTMIDSFEILEVPRDNPAK